MEAGADLGTGMSAVFLFKGKLLAAIQSTLDRYRTQGLKLPPKKEFMDKAEAFMKTIAAATDIPGIGPLLETTIEEYVIAGLLPVIGKLYDRFSPAQ